MWKVEVLMEKVDISWEMRILGIYGEESRFWWEKWCFFGFMVRNKSFY